MHFTINSFPRSIAVVIIMYDVAINMLLSTKMPSLMGVECVEYSVLSIIIEVSLI